MTRDMTSGSPMKLILKFLLPLLLGNLFQQMYNLVDSIIVGRILGLNAFSSVGASSSIIFLIIGFVNGTCSGFAIPVAQSFGAHNESDLRRYVFNSGILSAVLAVILTVITCLLCRNIFIWMGTPKEIIEGAYDYLIVIFIGIPFTFLYNILAGIIRSLGDSRTPFVFLIISTVLNIAGDMLLIVVFHMGVKGAAVATILAQAISGILCLIFIKRRFPILKMSSEEMHFDTKKSAKLAGIGLPMGLQFSITAVGSIMLQYAINALGTTIVAAYAAALKIKMFIMCPFDALASAMATFAGQNLGAGRIDRIKSGVRAGIIIGVSYGIISALILGFAGRPLTMLFVDRDKTEVLDYAAQYLLTIGKFYCVLAVLFVLRNAIQGLGYSIPAFFGGVCEMVARSFMSFVIIPRYGFGAACYTDPAAWVAAVGFLAILYVLIMKRLSMRHSV